MNLLLPFISVFIPALLLQSVGEHWLERKDLLPRFSRPILAWGATALSGYIAFGAYFIAQRLGWAYLGILYSAAIYYWVRQRKDLKATFVGKSDSHLCRLAMVFIAMSYVGLLYLWQSDHGLGNLAENRFAYPLPIDNELPMFVADRFASGDSPKGHLGDWLSSDRPPLQSGFILLLRIPIRWFGDPETRAYAAGLLFQLLWVPGLWALLRNAGARRAETLSTVALVAFTGFCFLHSVYTWPKLSAAGFVLAGASLFLLRPTTGSRLGNWAAGAALCALGYLSHGGVIFSLLALAPLTLLMRPSKTMLAAALGTFLVIILPWMCYQKFYDPPGNRLFKWHIAGVIPIDERGFIETLQTSYRETTWPNILNNKMSNLAVLVEKGPWRIPNLSPANSQANQAAEFSHFFRAIGLGFLLLLFAVGAIWSLYKTKQCNDLLLTALLLVGWAALTLLIWILLMFGPGTTVIHQGSLATLLIFWTIPVVLLGRWWRGLFVLIAGLQIPLFITVWGPANAAPHGPLSVGFLALATSGALLLAWLTILAHRNQTAAD